MQTKGKIILYLGDSITEGVGASSVEKRYADIVTKQGQFAEGVNYGVGGTRLCNQSEDKVPEWSETFWQRALRMQDNADIITVFGGTNDYGHGDAPLGRLGDITPDTFYGAVHHLFSYLKQRYPLATIVCITPLHRTNECRYWNEFGVRNCASLPDYVQGEKSVCAQLGIPVLDLYNESGIYPDDEVNCHKYTVDGLHPNDLGYRLIADMLLDFLRKL